MAEVLFREKARQDPAMRDWRIESAGTWAVDGQPASQLGREAMASRKLDLSGHRSQAITAELLGQFNLVLTMEKRHQQEILREFPNAAGRVYRLSEMAGRLEDVEDPYGLTAQEYEETADQIEELIGEGLDEILRRARDRSKT
jgi:protein-tyrosine-phosphatase